jgi:hypothetical protein
MNPANPIPPDRRATVASNFIETLRSQLASGDLQSAFNISPQHGIMLVDASSVENAWGLLRRYSFFPHWVIEMTPLVDAIEFVEANVAAARARA